MANQQSPVGPRPREQCPRALLLRQGDLRLYNTKEKLEKLAARPDLDTVCAFDYYRMKSFALGSSSTQGKYAGLRYEDFVPQAQGVKVPTL